MISFDDTTAPQVLDGHDVVIVDFWADWCGPCHDYGPVFAKVAGARPDLTFAKCDIDEAPDLADELGIQSIPATVVFVAGEGVAGCFGAMTAAELNEFIDEALGSSQAN